MGKSFRLIHTLLIFAFHSFTKYMFVSFFVLPLPISKAGDSDEGTHVLFHYFLSRPRFFFLLDPPQ